MSNSNNNNNMQANPFWDFIASMQDPRNNRFSADGPPHGGPQGEGFDPFQGNFGWGPFGQMPYRSRGHEHGGPRGSRSPPPPEHERDEPAGPPSPPGPHHGHGHGHGPHGRRGPPPPGPPPPPHHGEHPPPPPPPAFGGPDEKHTPPPPPPPPGAEDPHSRASTPPTPPTEHRGPHGHGPHGHGPHGHGPHGHGPHGHGPGRRGGRFGMRGGHGHGPGPHGPGPHEFGGPEGHGHGHDSHGHGRRGHGGPRGFGGPGHRHRGPGGPPPGPFPFDLNTLIEAFAPGLLGGANNSAARVSNDDGNFHPELDLFDTVEAYILHLSLPGAKKSDISTTYSSARNSVTVSGVVTRPGVDEEMMGTLARDERKVGAFEREIRLEEGVKIDEDGISAKLEDGVLRVIVPKVMGEEEEEYVDVKKIELD